MEYTYVAMIWLVSLIVLGCVAAVQPLSPFGKFMFILCMVFITSLCIYTAYIVAFPIPDQKHKKKRLATKI